MADKPVGEVVAVDAALDALSSPTSSDVYEALGPYSNDAVAAVAAKRAAAGAGGGGSQPGITAYTVTPADVVAAPGSATAHGTATGQTTGVMTYTAIPEGVNGNAVAIVSDVVPSVGALTVEVSGSTITLHLETDGDSVVLSTFGEVKAAILATPAAAALVTIGAITGGPESVYDGGDVYLAQGASAVTLGSLAAGSVIYDATVFIPAAWDAGTGFSVDLLGFADDLDPSAADSDNGDVLVSQQPLFDLATRSRTPAGTDVVLVATSDGAVPSTGELLLLLDVRTPA